MAWVPSPWCFFFWVVIGPDFLLPAMGLPRPGRTPADPAIRLATLGHPANYIADLAGLLLSASFVLLTVGLHDHLRATAPNLSRLALIAAVIGGAVGMVGMMVISYSRSAVGAIEDPAIAQAAMKEVDFRRRWAGCSWRKGSASFSTR